jgi:hypothetical protein
MDQETKSAFLNVHQLMLELLDLQKELVAGLNYFKMQPEMLEKIEETREHLEKASSDLGL